MGVRRSRPRTARQAGPGLQPRGRHLVSDPRGHAAVIDDDQHGRPLRVPAPDRQRSGKPLFAPTFAAIIFRQLPMTMLRIFCQRVRRSFWISTMR